LSKWLSYPMFFTGLEGTRIFLADLNGGVTTKFHMFLSGMVAGLCFWTCTYPMDSVKSIL